ncbi:nitronate monooxygenase [Streptomyces fulvoviolaceus]|uniref:nitronate monooxygenase n=1 Tax=Streptomyces fulvoviolaceus TaxID=285535 RepID=UPI000693DA37|nr:nitronate monooxygenase [Streptomyces fulvoviolaceus]
MTLSTAFTELFGVRHPIALAPMGGSAGGALAAAVSRGGGLGLVGVGGGERELLDRELPLVSGAGKPWGVGFLTWQTEVRAVEHALEYGPRAVMLSFGDPEPSAPLVGRFVGRGPVGAGRAVPRAPLRRCRTALDFAGPA